MAHAELIAKRLHDVLTSLGHPCTLEGRTLGVTRWSLRVEVVEGQENCSPNGVIIMPTIVASHPLLPHGFARELGVGLSDGLEQAANNVAANWMLLFFPLLKFLFEDDAHDCTVHEEPVDLPADRQPYRLVASAVWAVGFEKEGPGAHVSQSLLWNAFSDLLLPRLSPGVHHIRCFAAAMPDGRKADVFVDGAQWAEGTERLRELAQRLPTPDAASPIRSLKQQLLVRPSDLETGARREQEWCVARWTRALDRKIGPGSGEHLTSVLLALFTLPRCCSEEQQWQSLLGKGLAEPAVEELISFLQSAAARVLLDGKAQFSDTYYLVNQRTRLAVERRYDQTSIFTTGLEAFGTLMRQGLATEEIQTLAQWSAEMSGVRQAIAKTGNFTGGRFTQMIHSTRAPIAGVDLDTLLSKPKPPQPPPRPQALRRPPPPVRSNASSKAAGKPWWKIW
jgi:hypothetical protein